MQNAIKQYEAVVIGAGPGGYECALELAKGGVKTLLIDRSKERIGGTCLNEGCIPSKIYLQSAHYFSKIPHMSELGLEIKADGFNIQRLIEKTTALKNEIRSGVVWLLEQAGVALLYGSARFVDANTLEVDGEQIGFEKCIIATGSASRESSTLKIDGKCIISSRELFELQELPKSIVIIGGGPIGCEVATFFRSFGVEVTLVIRGSRLLSNEDEDVSKALLRAFNKVNIKVITSALVEKTEIKDSGVELSVKAETNEQISCDLVLCAMGRIPYTQTLECEKAGVMLSEKGFVDVNASFQSSQKHIFALGDCIDTPAFAHTAYAEARVVAYNIINDALCVNPHISPSTIFTDPAVASCGLSENEAKERGIAVEVKKAFFKVNAKAKILGDDSGFAKMIISAQSGVILGAAVVGVEATEIIHEMVLAIEQKASYKDVKEMIHTHPSVSEIFRYI